MKAFIVLPFAILCVYQTTARANRTDAERSIEDAVIGTYALDTASPIRRDMVLPAPASSGAGLPQ